MSIANNIVKLNNSLPVGVQLVAVSKTKPVEMVLEAYEAGQRDFGENYVQELCDKQVLLPKDIKWHFIGHLQTNKVKQIVPFVHLIHSVDSTKLLEEINKQAAKVGRVVDCLLQVYIATEESKFGFEESEIQQFIANREYLAYSNVRILGLMGMASFSEDMSVVGNEFNSLYALFEQLKSKELPSNVKMEICSMGMSGDYKLAIEKGSNMVRVGSLIFGNRVYSN